MGERRFHTVTLQLYENVTYLMNVILQRLLSFMAYMTTKFFYLLVNA